MKSIKNSLTIFFLSFIVFTSCKKDEKVSNQKISKENLESEAQEDTLQKAKSAVIFSFENQDNTEVIKITASEVSDDDKFFLVGSKNILTASKYKKSKDKLQFIKSEKLFVSDYYYVHIDPKHVLIKKIQKEDYFLFAVEEAPMGNGDTEYFLDFIILNISNLNFYTLKYSGEATLRSDESIDGKFLKNETLESNILIKKELYEFANKSKWVYNPSEKEKNINYYKNFEQKWYLDNDKHLDPSVFKSTYYTENLFQYNGNYNNDQVTENTDFKIVTYFRNNIIGYDKNKKLYFPIFVENCVSGCHKEVKFISESEIEISYSEIQTQKPDTIDLHKIKFTN
ncbi:hypothetical protein ACFSJW_02780 [Flavobacterium artemisiae]|uniref:Lipoprotein n=1 Tax=Flavobacterium artemisiae TaxID=2126556 RepID=A0ABW4HJH8_9FLAO